MSDRGALETKPAGEGRGQTSCTHMRQTKGIHTTTQVHWGWMPPVCKQASLAVFSSDHVQT